MDAALPPHPFRQAPHATLVRLALPVLVSLAAEPITGAVDTAFVARLGAPSLAALGVGATLLSGVFWIFNFLGVGSQTEVAQRLGHQKPQAAAEMAALALVLALLGASALGALAVVMLDTDHPQALVWLWVITGGWITLRAFFGILRIWPGVGQSPLAPAIHRPSSPPDE